MQRIGPFPINTVTPGDCRALIPQLPDESINVIITSPPYWGQRAILDGGIGVEADPRTYVDGLVATLTLCWPKLKPDGIMWVNLGDTVNTPINFDPARDQSYSTLGGKPGGLSAANSTYTVNRPNRKAVNKPDEAAWLQPGTLLALPQRFLTGMMDMGWLFRGEVIWVKPNPLPEGRARRPHRAHEPIYLFAKTPAHQFRVAPPVKTVWTFPPDRVDGLAHGARFPRALPAACLDAYGKTGPEVTVLDPFAGSGTTGVAAIQHECRFVGMELDPAQAAAATNRTQGTLFT